MRIRDLFIIWRNAPDDLQRAKDAERAAEQRLAEAHERAPVVRRAAAWARETRERNHLTELFVQSLGEGRS